MKKRLLILLLLMTYFFNSEGRSPRVIIIGAGVSGVAAASRLLENGFDNITILEAENRIGGRIHSVKIGGYVVDLGAEWVVGEEGNAVYDLADPLGLLEKCSGYNAWNTTARLFGSSGEEIPRDVASGLVQYFNKVMEEINSKDESDDVKAENLGQYFDPRLDKYFKDHPEISPELHEPLKYLLNLLDNVHDAGKSWYDVSVNSLLKLIAIDGDHAINWKERAYSMLFDLLMKKYPNPEEELPVKNITKLNTKVSEIKYEENPVKVITANKEEYSADHVIVTPSLGVLQKNMNTLFNPQLPEKKFNAIKNLSFGGVAKIILYYENPWWLDDPTYIRAIYWTEDERKELENDSLRKWMLSVSVGMRIEHKPKLLLLWVSGSYVKEMELVPEELFQEQVKEFVGKFFGKTYNITEPTEIKRSMWNTNENFLGTYRSPGLPEDKFDTPTEDYAEPILINDKPVLQFAGEGSSVHWGMVNGAIESGWREADRLINYYAKN
ncbi:protein anon-37Cs-like isoform X3 [Cotesia glomerata]|uniref:protein anon-37Cs-like isoform X3 n=1 Tax=Cotesia glomerata TaxID=32391 RepID=UPI001D01FC3F|nr:protein anon-37Cs-like isoform X3 [Cotesia glomerata]